MPNQNRRALWIYLLKPTELRAQYNVSFTRLFELGKTNGTCVNQIHLDIRRTWRTHRDFRPAFQKYQKALFEILVAYAAFDPDVEYCQGTWFKRFCTFRISQNSRRMIFGSLDWLED